MTRRIYVTRPAMPPLEKLLPHLKAIWDSEILTNCGPMHARLEGALAEYLGVPHVALFCNGTIALITALQALRITGEVITTPYSFVATTHALHWNGIKPVFVDLLPGSFNVDPVKIEAAITPQTTAILGVHCYGRPCDAESIERIAENYSLKVIYDAAHAFGVADSGGSILRHGDLSVLSFHATKVFHTFEGGAVVCPDEQTKVRIDRLKNFGFVDETTVVAPGINGKMSEFNAAFGMVLLDEIAEHIAHRGELDRLYREALDGISGISCIGWPAGVEPNFSYFPILVDEEFPLCRDALYSRLKESGIFVRRYFYPLISEFPTYRGLHSASRDNLPNAHSLANRILCLPMGSGISVDDASAVIEGILGATDRRA